MKRTAKLKNIKKKYNFFYITMNVNSILYNVKSEYNLFRLIERKNIDKL